jgi:monofunctional biosynthetic peptidoglycan transglycosylase
MSPRSALQAVWTWLRMVLWAGLGLQIFFMAQIGVMRYVDPPSTAFERSQIWQILHQQGHLPWRQEWVDAAQISGHLKRAAMASEDSAFLQHNGVWWESIEKAWGRNEKAKATAAKQATQQASKQAEKRAANSGAKPGAKAAAAAPAVKIVGGSTITQQLAKNLLLSGERTLLRKAQEFVLTLALEALLPKQRILEIYLNHVEWGEGVFGAQAAAQHYFKKPAAQLSAWEAARLAVMLPRPRYFEKRPQSPYLAERAQTIVNRMNDVVAP